MYTYRKTSHTGRVFGPEGFWANIPAMNNQDQQLEKIANRIKDLRRGLKKNQAEFAEEIGVEQPTVSRWENGLVYPEPENLERLAALANMTRVEFEWDSGNETPVTASQKQPEDSKGVLISGEIAAGVWVEQSAIDEPAEYLTGFVPDARYAHLRQFALLVRGDSMNEIIRDGEYVICVDWVDLGKVPETDDVVVVLRQRFGGQMRETTLKQIVVTTDGQIELWPRSNNPRFKDCVKLCAEDEEDGTTTEIIGFAIQKTSLLTKL
jgi:transcriptional regulator with XRE-family HTH domain